MVQNLIKLCVGISRIEDLEELDPIRRENGLAHGYGSDAHVHITRMFPKRADEIVENGSLYWVMSGKIQGRQRVVDLVRSEDHEGRACCHFVLDPEIVRTVQQGRRPFQGWRYLSQRDAPADIPKANFAAGDENLAAELAELGLL